MVIGQCSGHAKWAIQANEQSAREADLFSAQYKANQETRDKRAKARNDADADADVDDVDDEGRNWYFS